MTPDRRTINGGWLQRREAEAAPDRGVTHFVSYEPRNMGRDYVMSACGVPMHISEYASRPSCPDPRCREAARDHHFRLLRERLQLIRACNRYKESYGQN